jgi:hypothetical protein
MFLKSPPVTPPPNPRMRMSSPATVYSIAREPDQEPDQAVSAPFFPPTTMEASHGTLEEPIKLSSSSLSSSMSSSVSDELTESQTQKMQQADDAESNDSEATLC